MATETARPGVALAMSGGGFRATLFHLGSVWRLNEIGWLGKLARISSISGGSITAGSLARHWADLKFEGGVARAFQEKIVAPLREFCGRNVDTFSIAEGVLLPGKRVSDAIEEEYREHLFGDFRLDQLPDEPRFVVNATNLATGVSFRFCKPFAGDYRIGLIKNPDFRLSLAVTASSAFPPVLSPVVIETDPERFEKVVGADLWDDVRLRETLYLTDGGVYDNLGLEPVWDDFETVLVGDAGAALDVEPKVGSAWHTQAMRALSITINQNRALRKRKLVADFAQQIRRGTYWGIGTPIRRYGIADALAVPDAVTAELAAIRTRLDSFTTAEQSRLVNWGYAVCDAAMRKHVLREPVPPPRWPYPEFALDQNVSA